MRRRRRWPYLATAGGVVLLLVAGPLWVGARGVSARDHLLRAAALVQQLRAQLISADPAAASTLTRLQGETGAARADTRDLGWGLGARLPAVGDEFAAVRTVAAALDDLARDGLPPLVATAADASLAALAPRGGRIDLLPLRRSAPRLAAADRAVRRARAQIAAIATAGLSPTVRAAVTDLDAKLGQAAAATATAARATAVLPAMLGADGPRTYLVLFQNSAELRSTGGMPGAYVVLRADRGRIRLTGQGTAGALAGFDRPVLPLLASDRHLWTDRLGTLASGVNLTPHFPTAAALAREMLRRRTGQTVDGVLATDPVALSYLLGALGPVPVPIAGAAPLTAANAVPTLLSRMYAGDIPVAGQDAFFAAAAKAVFAALTGRRPHPAALIAALARGVGERRVLVWSAEPAVNARLAGTMLAGVLPAADGTRPTIGVFLNDGSGAKLDYYLRQAASVTVGGCRPGGRRELALRVTLRSTAPRSGLSEDVTGLALAGDPYTARTLVAIYSPSGGAVLTMRLDGAARSFGAGTDRGRAVGSVVVDVPAGRSRRLDVDLLTAPGLTGTVTPRLWTTPAVTSWQQSVESADGCSSGG